MGWPNCRARKCSTHIVTKPTTVASGDGLERKRYMATMPINTPPKMIAAFLGNPCTLKPKIISHV